MNNMEMPQKPEENEKEPEFKQFERAITAASPYVEELKGLVPDIEKSEDLSTDEKTELLYKIRVLVGGEDYFTRNRPSTYGNREDEVGLTFGQEFYDLFSLIGKAKSALEYQELDKQFEASTTLNALEKNKLRGAIQYLLH